MKRFLTVAILIAGAALAHAEPKPSVNGSRMPDPSNYTSQAVYITSNSNATSANMSVSGRAALLAYVSINLAGSANSRVEVYDARLSTLPATARKIATIDGSSSKVIPFNIGCSSGIVWYITGTNLPDATMGYLER